MSHREAASRLQKAKLVIKEILDTERVCAVLPVLFAARCCLSALTERNEAYFLHRTYIWANTHINHPLTHGPQTYVLVLETIIKRYLMTMRPKVGTLFLEKVCPPLNSCSIPCLLYCYIYYDRVGYSPYCPAPYIYSLRASILSSVTSNNCTHSISSFWMRWRRQGKARSGPALTATPRASRSTPFIAATFHGYTNYVINYMIDFFFFFSQIANPINLFRVPKLSIHQM